MPDKYRRWQEMEIKHGRIAMLATLHVIATGAGYKWEGYASEENTWEPVDNVSDDLIAEWREEQKRQRKVAAKSAGGWSRVPAREKG